MCTSVIQYLSHSQSFIDRIIFIEICYKVYKLCSNQFFKREFINSLFSFEKETNISVRIKLSQCIPKFRKVLLEDDSDLSKRITNLLETFADDKNRTAQEIAIKSQMDMMSIGYWKKLRSSKYISRERERIKYEEAQEVQEIKEAEESKKRVVDDLTNKARVAYTMAQKAKLTPKPRTYASTSPIGRKQPEKKSGTAKIEAPRSPLHKASQLSRLRKGSPSFLASSKRVNK